jgi:hypothetical protein
MITHYFYNEQLRAYILQFCNIFNGLQVMTGKGECDEAQFISVPCVVGNKDRVVAAIMAGNTQNRVFSVPIMSAYMSSIELAPERRKAPSYVDQKVTMKVGGVFPDDLTTIKRAMPIPYNMRMELAVFASNTQQLHQILEQLLVLFNPDLQIQKNDAEWDWTTITKVELVDIANEENYPSSTDRRNLVWTFTFDVPIWLSIPMGVKDDLVRKIIVSIGIDNGGIQEIADDGSVIPFSTTVAQFEITDRPPEGPVSDFPLPV